MPSLISPPYSSMVDLGTLGGSYSTGFSINSSGQVTGSSNTTGDSSYHAFLISPPYTAMTDLGTLGGTYAFSLGINSSGQVVGYSQTTGGSNDAFLYTSATGMVDLNTLLPSGSGWVLGVAKTINDAGQITGNGVNPSGALHAFLLSPASISSLINLVNSFNLPAGTTSSLVAKLLTAQAATGNASCQQLDAFIQEVQAESGKALTTTQANQLIAMADAVKAGQGCP